MIFGFVVLLLVLSGLSALAIYAALARGRTGLTAELEEQPLHWSDGHQPDKPHVETIATHNV